ncbi:MAG: hypothetical protein QM831_32900 [Kofleriaceae bacterium]
MSGRAVADPAAAKQLADEGATLAKAGKWSEAAEKYRAAWNDGHVDARWLCNAGITVYKAKDLVRAHLWLDECLAQSTDPKLASQVRNALTATESVMRASGHAPVKISSTPPASISILELGNDEAFVGSRVVWLPFGTYHVRAHAEGYLDQTAAVEPKSQNAMTLDLTLEHVKVQVEEPGKPPVQQDYKPPPPLPPPPKAEPPGLALPIAATIVTIAAAGFAVYARGQASHYADDAQTAFDPNVFNDEKKSADHWNAAFVTGASVAVVGAAASVLLWHRKLAWQEPVEVQASAHSVSVGLTVHF